MPLSREEPMSEPKFSLPAMSLVSGALVCALACATSSSSPVTTTPAASGAPAAAVVPNLYDTQRQVEQYIASGRYEADLAKVVDAARAWLEERAKAASKPAIVLDI